MSDNKLMVKILKYPTEENWNFCKDSALVTMGKALKNDPNMEWKYRILMSEHSPIRSLSFIWEWTNLPYCVSVHFVRHKIGIEHYVKSQRNDRQNNYNRNESPQNAPVNHRCIANTQAMINISRKRLCNMASKETREAWQLLLDELNKTNPEIVHFCVPECVYRNGICPEFKGCGYNKSDDFKNELNEYLGMLWE